MSEPDEQQQPRGILGIVLMVVGVLVVGLSLFLWLVTAAVSASVTCEDCGSATATIVVVGGLVGGVALVVLGIVARRRARRG